MSEIEEFQEQLEDLLQGIQSVLQNEVSRMKGSERAEKCGYLRNRIQRAKQVHRSIQVEMRELPEEKLAEWRDRSTAYEQRIARLVQDIDWAETAVDREVVGKKTVDDMSAKEMTQQALQVQEKSQMATSRVKAVLEETIEIGAVTAAELKRQGDQIRRVQDDVDRVETNLRRANKQLMVFMRRMATDKIFLFMIFLIVVGVVLAIVFSVLKKQGIPPFGQKDTTTKTS